MVRTKVDPESSMYFISHSSSTSTKGSKSFKNRDRKENPNNFIDFVIFLILIIYFLMIFIFSIIVGLQCSVNFLQYSKETQSHIYAFFFSYYPPSCSIISD